MNITEILNALNEKVPFPEAGLPEEVFQFVSRITPLVNVDLLIKDESGRTLLSWRDDPHTGTGWHVPGGIVRFRETFETRLKKVALNEIGTELEINPVPVAFNQLIHPEHKIRSHCISILYKCFLPSSYSPLNPGRREYDKGYLMWHSSCPRNLIEVHDLYRDYIGQS